MAQALVAQGDLARLISVISVISVISMGFQHAPEHLAK